MGGFRKSNWHKMEIIKAANTWAKAEIASSYGFMLFGLIYLLVSIAFWQLAKTPLTKALIIPLSIAGGLLFSAGISFYSSNKSRLTSFKTEYEANPSALVASEIDRTKKTITTYENVALKVFPAIILVAALVAIFISAPIVRGICIGIIAFLSVLVALDSQALKRTKVYHQQLESAADLK